jgi:hypothetical protein
VTRVRICPRRVPSFKDRLDADAATEAFLEHECDRMLLAALAGERAGGAAGRVRPRRLHHVDHREEMRQIHDEIWPILECYPDRVDDPSPQSPDVRAARVFFFICVSPGR